jgi:YggT family protein
MGGYFSNAGAFLIELVLGLYIYAVLLRFLLQRVRADFYNPLSQALVKITNPPLRPLRRLIPGLWGIDLASVVLLLVLAVIERLLLNTVLGLSVGPAGAVIMAVADLLQKTVWVFLIALFARAILSWVAPGTYNPVTGLLTSLTEPLARPARRILPPISGLDLSFILVIAVLYLILMLVVQPLWDLGRLVGF